MYPEYLLKVKEMAMTPPAASMAGGNYQPKYDYASSALPAGARANAASEPHLVPVRGNIYLLAGAGANMTVSIGDNGVALVDTGSVTMTPRVLALIQQLARRINPAGAMPPLRFMVNTHVDSDHTGGNGGLMASPMYRPIEGSMKEIGRAHV